MSGRRFVTRDLRENEELLYDAIALAKTYTGDWDVMCAAQELAERTGTLPLDTARMVLNASLADPYAHLHGDVPRPPAFTRKPKLHVVREPEPPPRKVMLRANMTIKWPVGVTAWKSAIVRIHDVDTERSHCRWHRPRLNDGWDSDFTQWVPRPYIYWACGKYTERVTLYPSHKAVLLERPDLLRCPKCVEATA